jgi:hypothetical protein
MREPWRCLWEDCFKKRVTGMCYCADHAKHEPAFLCKITVTQVFDKRGRPIIRYNGGKKKPTPQPDGGK